MGTRIGLLSLISLLLSACGGGGGTATAPLPAPQTAEFRLSFPGTQSLTDSGSIDVVGTISVSEISAVLIRSGSAEVAASADSNGLWRAEDVPLQPGANNLIAVLTEPDGDTIEQPLAMVRSEPVLSSPAAVAFDPVDNRVLIADAKQLLAFDPGAASLQIVSSASVGSGPGFSDVRHLALASDGAVLVSDVSSVFRVDPETGNRTEQVVLSDGTFPNPVIALDPSLDRLFTVDLLRQLSIADLSLPAPVTALPVKPLPPFGVSSGPPVDAVYVAETNAVYAVDQTSPGVWRIDANSGDATFLFLSVSGVSLQPTPGIEYDDVGRRLLLLDLFGTAFEMDASTGVSTLVSSPPSPTLRGNIGLAEGGGNFWTVSTLPAGLLSVDPSTGARTVEYESVVGSGADSSMILGGRFDEAADRFITFSGLSLIAIDPRTGVRQQIADLPATGLTGGAFGLPRFSLVSGMELSADGRRLWMTELTPGSLVEFDLTTGQFSDIWIAGPDFTGPLDQIAGVAVNTGETVAYVGDRFGARIFEIDLVTGQRNVLADFSTQISQGEIRTIVLDAASNRMLVDIFPRSTLATVQPGIYELNLTTLEFSELVNLSSVVTPFVGIRAPQVPVTQMSLNPDGDTLYYPVRGEPDFAFLRIDLVSGTFTELSHAAAGPPFFLPSGIEVTADGRLFALDGTTALFGIDEQTGQRVILSK